MSRCGAGWQPAADCQSAFRTLRCIASGRLTTGRRLPACPTSARDSSRRLLIERIQLRGHARKLLHLTEYLPNGAQHANSTLAMPQILTKYFGPVEYGEADIIQFPSGLPAFEDETQFLTLEPQATAPLIFLQ